MNGTGTPIVETRELMVYSSSHLKGLEEEE